MAEETGTIKDFHPPGNNGLQKGQGEILWQGKTLTFDTPDANDNQVLVVNQPCTFRMEDGVVTKVTQNK